MFLLFIWSLLFSDFLISDLNRLFQVILLIVELFFQGEEMLIQRNTISQQGFVTRCLVFLIDLPIFQKFDFVLHKDDLFLKIQNVLISEVWRSFLHRILLNLPLFLLVGTFQIGVTFELFISGSCILGCKIYIALSSRLSGDSAHSFILFIIFHANFECL